MNILRFRRQAVRAAIGLSVILLAGCVVPDGGGGWPGYYEPAGVVYGGWGPGYLVGPVYGGGYRGGRGGFGGGQHAFRAAPAFRGAPSIPGARGGGARGGGGGRGGGRR